MLPESFVRLIQGHVALDLGAKMSHRVRRDVGNSFNTAPVSSREGIKQPLPPPERVPWMLQLLKQSKATHRDDKGGSECQSALLGQVRTEK